MRTRRAAGVALFAFFVAMACFGMLSRAIDDASVARVSVVRAAPQALAGAAGEMPDEPGLAPARQLSQKTARRGGPMAA